jgi:hypothetical protein
MVARIAGSMIVSVAVLIVVSFLVSFGVLWWTGSILAVLTLLFGIYALVDELHDGCVTRH